MSTLPADAIYLDADFLPAIPPSNTMTASLEWDTEGFGGDVDLYVVLDPAGQVNETNEDSNSAFQPIHVKSRADLQVVSLTTSETYPRNGRPVTVTAVISNAGETDNSGVFTVAFTDLGGLWKTSKVSVPRSQFPARQPPPWGSPGPRPGWASIP